MNPRILHNRFCPRKASFHSNTGPHFGEFKFLFPQPVHHGAGCAGRGGVKVGAAAKGLQAVLPVLSVVGIDLMLYSAEYPKRFWPH